MSNMKKKIILGSDNWFTDFNIGYCANNNLTKI